MPNNIPSSKPAISRAEVEKLIIKNGIVLNSTNPLLFVGIRGYFASMGVPGKNDIGIYDDAILIVSDRVFAAFNANTDPSNNGQTGRASLIPGLYFYTKGIHGASRGNGYPAFRQAGPVKVKRHNTGHTPVGKRNQWGVHIGNGVWTDEKTDWFWINLHRGGYNTTSSLGCQTIYPTQWEAFKALGYEEATRLGVKKIPYLLVSLS